MKKGSQRKVARAMTVNMTVSKGTPRQGSETSNTGTERYNVQARKEKKITKENTKPDHRSLERDEEEETRGEKRINEIRKERNQDLNSDMKLP